MIYIWLASLVVALLSTFLAIMKLHRFTDFACDSDLPHVTIIKPLKGVQPGLNINLHSFFNLNYPREKYILAFCVAEPNDLALDFASSIADLYPHISVGYYIGGSFVGINPKINNIYSAYDKAPNDLILISDDTAYVEPTYLKKMVSAMKDDVGVVTSLVAGIKAESFAGQVETVYLNGFFTRALCLIYAAGSPAVMGKSMLFRKSDAERFGGLKAVANYLAEDYMIGEKMRELGKKIVLMSEPVKENLSRYSFSLFFNRHLRWTRLRKAHNPFAFFIEPFTMPVVTGAVGSYAFKRYGVNPFLFFTIHMAFSFVLDEVVLIRIALESLSSLNPLAWVVKETIALPFWLYSLSSNNITWKGHRMKLKHGGKIERVRARG